jgi:hypothetical protein
MSRFFGKVKKGVENGGMGLFMLGDRMLTV